MHADDRNALAEHTAALRESTAAMLELTAIRRAANPGEVYGVKPEVAQPRRAFQPGQRKPAPKT
jgi:hypothetical protein